MFKNLNFLYAILDAQGAVFYVNTSASPRCILRQTRSAFTLPKGTPWKVRQGLRGTVWYRPPPYPDPTGSGGQLKANTLYVDCGTAPTPAGASPKKARQDYENLSGLGGRLSRFIEFAFQHPPR